MFVAHKHACYWQIIPYVNVIITFECFYRTDNHNCNEMLPLQKTHNEAVAGGFP